MTLIWREHTVWEDAERYYQIESTAHGTVVAHTTDKSQAGENYFRDEFPVTELDKAQQRCQKHYDDFGAEFEDASSGRLGT